MKQSDIKIECDQIYQNIKLQQDKLTRLRLICEHGSYDGVVTFPGVHPVLTCSYCGKTMENEWQKYLAKPYDHIHNYTSHYFNDVKYIVCSICGKYETI